MDLFQYKGTGTTPFEEASLIEGYSSVSWIERYRDFSEFEIVAPTSAGLRQSLPIGTFISHMASNEVMIVENHEISDTDAPGVDVTITGRSLDAFLQERIVGSNLSWPYSSPQPTYDLASAASWDQVVTLINTHITPAGLVDDDDALTRVSALSTASGTATTELRPIERGNLHTIALEILQVDDLGIKVIRPAPGQYDSILCVHNGIDRSQKVAFSFDDGDLRSGKYLWSSKRSKTSAVIEGTWVTAIVHGPETDFERRVMHVLAKDIDEELEAMPTGGTLTSIRAKMETRGRQALAAQKSVAIVSVQIAKNATNYSYRKDYDIGDIVAVQGNYNSETTMRVIEHVEIEDQSGETSYPTLSLVE